VFSREDGRFVCQQTSDVARAHRWRASAAFESFDSLGPGGPGRPRRDGFFFCCEKPAARPPSPRPAAGS